MYVLNFCPEVIIKSCLNERVSIFEAVLASEHPRMLAAVEAKCVSRLNVVPLKGLDTIGYY